MTNHLNQTIQTVYPIPQGRNEIAAIFLGEPPINVQLKLYPRSDTDTHTRLPNDPEMNIDDNLENNIDNQNVQRRIHEIKTLNSYSDPMVYPLLFPNGDRGYQPNIPLQHNRVNEARQNNDENDNDDENDINYNDNDDDDNAHNDAELDNNIPQNQYHINHHQFVTCSQFYTYRLMIRENFSLLHCGGKLFQQYLVDAWGKSEALHLWYIRHLNTKFRIAKQKVLGRIQSRYQNSANAPLPVNFQNDLQNFGRISILPASFTSTPRHEYRLYLEAMTIVALHGKPDLFITFTCNSSWPEIRSNLGPKKKN